MTVISPGPPIPGLTFGRLDLHRARTGVSDNVRRQPVTRPRSVEAMRRLEEVRLRLSHARAIHDPELARMFEMARAWLAPQRGRLNDHPRLVRRRPSAAPIKQAVNRDVDHDPGEEGDIGFSSINFGCQGTNGPWRYRGARVTRRAKLSHSHPFGRSEISHGPRPLPRMVR